MTSPLHVQTKYKIKEIYYTLQGEGFHTGQPAIFCRFTGCNLWSGREEDRHKAICTFCDTQFVGMDGHNGGQYSAQELCQKISSLWPSPEIHPIWCVFTGGEPLLQLDETLIEICKRHHIYVAVESNGTLPAPPGIDWLCISPKSGSNIVQKEGHELKLVLPQSNFSPEQFNDWNFDHFSIQPLDDDLQKLHTKKAIEYCLQNPKWRLSIQLHKVLGLP